MTTRKEMARKRKEIIKQISVELDTCTANTACDVPRSTYESPDITCKDCPIYARIREQGEILDGLTIEKTGKAEFNKKAALSKLYTAEEDKVILDYFASTGGYHGIIVDISKAINRPPNSVHSRVKTLIKNKVLTVEAKKK